MIDFFMASNEIILKTDKLTKTFGTSVVANDAVSFDVRKGEIHCLLGENGAGKSTLAECLYGYYKPDSGDIYYKGKKVTFASPSEAIAQGIGMVHQHFQLVEPLSVIENIIVGTDTAGTIKLDLRRAEQKVKSLCDQYNIDLNLRAKIWQLAVGQQQWVEIFKALYLGAEVLILDEPTAVLTPQESEILFNVIKQMTADGMSIILISHKLNEVMQSDHVTILRKGKCIGTVVTAESSKEALVNMMVGRDVNFSIKKDVIEQGDIVLEIKDLRAVGWAKGLESLKGINLTVRKGEILGIAGVAGNGQKELFETLVGMREASDGSVLLDGEDITNQSPATIMQKGIGHIPDDRYRVGLVPDFSIADNLVLGAHNESTFSAGLFLNYKKINEFAKQAVAEYEIVTPSINTPVKSLSGGNAQKVILSRELSQCSKVLLANQPTRGLDVGAIEYVQNALLAKRKEGYGIILASEDLEELISISDRVAVIHGGEIMGVFDSSEADIKTIGLLMAGQRSV